MDTSPSQGSSDQAPIPPSEPSSTASPSASPSAPPPIPASASSPSPLRTTPLSSPSTSGSYPPPPPPPPTAPPQPPSYRPPVPQRPASSSKGWKIAAIVVGLVSGLGVLGLLALGFLLDGAGLRSRSSTHHAGPHLQEVVRQPGNAKQRILVINVDGVISSTPIDGGGIGLVDLIESQLERASEDEDIRAVILKVDSPGGEVLASDEIYKLLTDFQEKHDDKPVVVSMGNLAASGGYYISAPCRWIVANELTITGSIGVIMHGYNYRGLMDKVGVQPEVFKSGKYKDMLSGSKRPEEVSAEERQLVQKMVDETFQRFKTIVGEGRSWSYKQNAENADKSFHGRPLSPRWTEFADGRILSGKEAYELGFVDELGNFKTAVDRVSKIQGLHDPELIEYHPLLDLSSLLRLFGQTPAKSIKVDVGVNSLPPIKSGMLYFLWTMGVNP